jgi:trimeric autotransporter adhesin
MFADTDVGSMSAAQTVMVSAPNGDPVGFQLTSGNNDFVLSAGTCATQTPCQISINFKPTRIGSISASYVAVDLATTVASQLTLFGHGGISAVALSSSSLTFSPRALGTTSFPQSLTLTNTGDAVLTISAVTFIGANAGDFPIEGNTCGNSVAAGGNCTISVSFSPSASGSRSATLQVVSNAASSPDSIQLLGTGN